MGINYDDKKLIEKYNIPISSLDYSYIKNCGNVKEVQNILKILRSGEEGIYPDLIKFCENRLGEISPDDELLQTVKKVPLASDLPYEDQRVLQSEIKGWIDDIKIQDQELSCSSRKFGTKNNCPPIRNMNEVKNMEVDKKKVEKNNSFKPKKNVLSYEQWNKFDVESEIQKLDDDAIVQERSQDLPDNLGENMMMPSPYLNVLDLSEEERLAVAEEERTKGNECFKAREYLESVIYYSRSISAHPTAAAYNNRAMSNIKLENYHAALVDCDEVLNLEPDNVKALYRRGLAYMETNSPQLAYMAFQDALDIDPNCSAAKEKLMEMNKCPVSKTSKGKSLVIEEISDSVSIPKLLQKSDSNTIAPKSNTDSVISTCETKSILVKSKTDSVDNSNVDPMKEKVEINSVTTTDEKNGQDKTDCHLQQLETNDINLSDKLCEHSDSDTAKVNDNGMSQLSNSTLEFLKQCERKRKTFEDKNFPLNIKTTKCDSTEQYSVLQPSSIMSDVLSNDEEIQEECGDPTLPSDKIKGLPVDTNLHENTNSIKKMCNTEALNSEKVVNKCLKPLPEHSGDIFSNVVTNLSVSSAGDGQLHLMPPVVTAPVSHKVEMTPFKFLNLWHSQNANKNGKIGAEILSGISPEKLPSYISNKLDANLLNGIIKAVKEILNAGDWMKAQEIMKCLVNVPRIKTVSSFLSLSEKHDIEDVLSVIDENQKKELKKLREVFLEVS